MSYYPEALTIKYGTDHIATIVSQSGKEIAKIDLSHPVWEFGSKHSSDEQYMQSIKLLGDTKNISEISAIYSMEGTVIPVFKNRETKDGKKISYDTDFDSFSIFLRETKREYKDKIYKVRFNSYEHMQGLIVTKYAGYDIVDKKTGLAKIYDQDEKLIAEQIEPNKLKVLKSAGTKYTSLDSAEYAIIEPYGELERMPNGGISIHRTKPKIVTIHDSSGKEIAKFKFYEKGNIEECYQLDKEGKRKHYHHYNTSGKENTLLFLLRNSFRKRTPEYFLLLIIFFY